MTYKKGDLVRILPGKHSGYPGWNDDMTHIQYKQLVGVVQHETGRCLVVKFDGYPFDYSYQPTWVEKVPTTGHYGDNRHAGQELPI